jgi:uncharacterized phage-associated protein
MFRALLNDKIGTVIRHFAVKIPQLSLTKLLKLLYITDETAMRETGAPLTWLEYRVWKLGPVPNDIFQEIKHDEKVAVGNHFVSLDSYIRVSRQGSAVRQGQEEVFIEASSQDDLSLLSEYEIELLNRIIRKFGNMNAAELVEFLHREGSLWHKAVVENNLETNFQLYQNTSNHIIDFSDLIEDDEVLKMAAQSAFESLYLHKTIHENKLRQDV